MLDLLTDLFISAYMPPCQTSTPFDPTYSPASLPVASNRAEGTPDPFHPLEDDFNFSNLPDPATLDLPSFTILDVGPSNAAATTSSAALYKQFFFTGWYAIFRKWEPVQLCIPMGGFWFWF
jgi:hypothetical protein